MYPRATNSLNTDADLDAGRHQRCIRSLWVHRGMDELLGNSERQGLRRDANPDDAFLHVVGILEFILLHTSDSVGIALCKPFADKRQCRGRFSDGMVWEEKMKTVKLYTTAFLEDGRGGRVVVKIQVSIKGVVPEEPKVVLFERRAYVQTSQNPLTYVNVLVGRATRL